MYEITHDKAYLIKAINRNIELMNARDDATAPSLLALLFSLLNIFQMLVFLKNAGVL